VGKNAEKAVCRSVFLMIWHSILSAELTKSSDCFFDIGTTLLQRCFTVLTDGNTF